MDKKQGKKKMDEKAKLEAAFDSAKSVVQMTKAVKDMDKSKLFNVRDFDFAFWKLVQQVKPQNHNLVFGASSMQRNKIKRKKDFHKAQTADEMLKTLQKMELCFKEKELAIECWRLTQKLFFERGDPEKILCYGNRALQWSVDRSNANGDREFVSSLEMLTDTLPMMGCACWKLKRFNESMSYLNWSLRNLSKLELDSSFSANLVFTNLGATHFQSAIVKAAVGKGEEAVIHVTKIVENHKKMKELGIIDQASSISTDGVIDMVVEELKGLGLNEQDEAVRLLRESTRGGDSPEGNSESGI